MASPGKLYTYPSARDWRNWNGQDWTTPVRNQGGCGSCVGFGTVGAIESRLEIANNNSNLNPDLSEAHLFYCNGGSCTYGWSPEAALDAARDTGIVNEACYPYSDYQQSCSPCSNWQNQVTKISSWSGTSNVANMKQALADSGPLEATMAVYDDFFGYSGGIYRHMWGGLAGYHAVTLVGYNDSGGYWIAKNSWGTSWGEDKYGNPNGGGWFRIAYGESEIDNYVYIPAVSVADIIPPDGDYTSPPNNTIVGQTVHLAAWATDSGSGVKEVHFTAKWNNEWHLVYNDTSAPYEYDWNLCDSGVLDGDVELGLDIYDNAGNIFHLHLKHANPHITKSYNCTSCNPTANQVALYVEGNYSGQCVVKGVGQYPNPGAIGLPNDSVSSLRVGGDVRAILCRDDDYGGGCETFNGDDSSLSDNSVGNDQVSSVKVEQRTQPPSPPNLLSPDGGSIIDESSSIVLSWSATGNEYFGEIGGGPGVTLTFGWQSETSKNIGPQWAGYTYSWRVKARHAAGESGWSDPWTFTVKPGTPSNLSAQTVSCSQVNLYWTDNSGNEEGYKIYRNGSYVGQVGMNVINYQDGGLSGNTSYSYYVKAYRGSIESDASNTANITTPPCTTPKPDLVPSRWGGWQYPIVPSSITGTDVVNTLYAGRPTYVDWGITNAGNADTGANTYGDLYLDGARLAHYDFGNVQAGWTWAFFDWSVMVNTPGWHTLKSVADPDNFVAESDETNNVWERQFYWIPTAPYSDTMENDTNDWTATGLWHLVNQNSPYPASHSGMQSRWYGQDSTGNYDTGAANSGDLTSRSIYIPSTGYYLRFWYQYETETQGPDWDQRWVQISVDGGSFNNVLQLYDDPKNWWLQSPAIDLSGYAGHTIQVRFYFDTIGSILNAYRGWYIDDVSISSSPPPNCADTHEPNNVASQATAIAYGQTLSGYICPGSDYDWYAFTGTAGDKVIVDIDAKASGSSLDPYIFLVDGDGTSVLAENDDEIPYEVQDSKLGYQLSHNGIHYIKVRAWDHPAAGGTDYFYNIRLFTDTVAPAAAITSPASDSYLNPTMVMITVSANDSGSGINHIEFWWHDADWQNSNWVWLGADYDGRDNWSWNFDTSSLPEQRGGAFYIWASDWIGNGTSAGAWNLGIDRTPPEASVRTSALYGDAPFRDFFAWWGGRDNLSGIASYDVQYRDGATGNWINWLTGTANTYYRFVGQNGHTYYFRARACDQAGNLGDYTDGSASYTIQICPTSPDAYEVDNLHASAKWIDTNGISQTHTIHTEGDQDWVRFFAVGGAAYTLMTANVGGHADTVLYLYGADGSTLIAYNDDYPLMGYASRIDWRPTASGVYYAMVKHWDVYANGCTTNYELSIASDAAVYRAYLPLTLRDCTHQ